ncbi:2-hydroxychromene-2-carboxylate isomerase [Oleisolibacter albus]|uniref:2-hydroxychromene-2-carboxylate isomerase n=1 Tax=Oleisolibacter albus TaxID=2171757 RepID=UPI000DF134A1|nr:DsbA family protein [Oleisolibacter albus]
MPAPIRVDFYFSPASPYAYLASTQMMQLQVETGCRVDWHPLWGRALVNAAGYNPSQAAAVSGQFRPEYRSTDLARWARLYNVPFRNHADVVIPDPQRLAIACVAAKRFDAGQVFARALMKAIFVEGRTPADEALCLSIANDTAGIEPHLFQPKMDDPETAALLDASVQAAVAAGCFGVPSFVVHHPDGGSEMVFGNDRLPLLKQAVRAARDAGA